ncbi:hypothetical protein F4677DRAFT_382688 [Hypoxylon crocopeplum]|nr:hypothetical protein F4677DRAFT_382688 [Hypoxylon crocopeplum]
MAPYLYKLPQWSWAKSWAKTGDDRATYKSLPGGRSSMDNDSEDGLLEKGHHGGPPQQPIWKSKRFLAAHGALLVVYAFILFLVASQKKVVYQGLPYSPARNALTWEDHAFDLEDHIHDGGTPYVGKPSEELDQVWHDLLNDENIKIEPKYIEYLNRKDTAVEVPEGGWYLGTLNVYHELHCLKRIHQFMYPDYYFPGLDAEMLDLNRKHNEHCIDFLRQSAMCHGDVGLITYSWHAQELFPVPNSTHHTCVNWNKLDKWTKDRSVDMLKPGWLVHPLNGVVYPDGEGDIVGFGEHID